MSVPNSKPDLDESMNVSEAHGRLIREAAATAREKRIADNGHEPVSLWLFVVCGVAILVAGAILGNVSGLYDYSATFKEGYVRSEPPGGAESGPKPKEALAAYSAKGSKLYSAKCSGCHGPDGRGDGANYPSLAGSKRVLGPTEGFAMVILNGMQGPTSYDKVFGAGLMPPQGAGMSEDDLATIMSFVRNGFGNTKGDIVTPEMAKAGLEISAKRPNAGQPVTSAEVMKDHQKDLPGTPLDPKTMVNAVTLAPVAK